MNYVIQIDDIEESQKSYVLMDKFDGQVYSMEEVCLEYAKQTGIYQTGKAFVKYYRVAQKCLGCSKEKPCVNFCCAKGSVKKGESCVPSDEENLSEYENLTYINIERKCETHFVKTPRKQLQYTSSGVLIDGKEYALDKYCIDTLFLDVLLQYASLYFVYVLL